MSQAVTTDLLYAEGDELNAFTFWVGGSLFAINLENVLSIEQDQADIQPDPFQGRGTLGIVKHRGVPVRVFDFAGFLGFRPCAERKQELIDTLFAREQDHVEWLTALECAIKTGEPFTKTRDPHRCAFGQWYDGFKTRDEELMEILGQFDEPHKRIHSLADRLLELRDRGGQDEALQILTVEQKTTLMQLRHLFERARSQVHDGIKSVLLFVTTDGKEARIALRLSEISDMVSFNREQLTPTGSLGVADSERLSGVFTGYLNSGTDKDCLLVDIDGLLDAILQSQ